MFAFKGSTEQGRPCGESLALFRHIGGSTFSELLSGECVAGFREKVRATLLLVPRSVADAQSLSASSSKIMAIS